MVSFSTRYTPEQQARINAESRDRYRRENRDLERKVAKLEKELDILKNANQEVAYWKDLAEWLQEYIDIIEE
tara:strand:+ start:1415 stop:1630 length:216 start_codon:yes stop_codon:yes gene_type:complete